MSLRSARFARVLTVSLVFASMPGVLACGRKQRVESKSEDEDDADTGKKKKKKGKEKKSADPVATYLATMDAHLRKKSFDDARDQPPAGHVTGTMTTRRALLTEADVQQYPNEPIPRPAWGLTREENSLIPHRGVPRRAARGSVVHREGQPPVHARRLARGEEGQGLPLVRHRGGQLA